MEYLSLIFLHVFFGVFWAGGAISAGLFFIPAIADAGPAGGPVVAGLMKRNYSIALTVAGLVVVLSGVRLYMVRFSTDWLSTPEGIVLTIGGLLGLGALTIGLLVQKPTAQRMGALAAQIAAAGGPPTPAQATEMQELRERLRRVGRFIAWHLLGATAMMAAHKLAASLSL